MAATTNNTILGWLLALWPTKERVTGEPRATLHVPRTMSDDDFAHIAIEMRRHHEKFDVAITEKPRVEVTFRLEAAS